MHSEAALLEDDWIMPVYRFTADLLLVGGVWLDKAGPWGCGPGGFLSLPNSSLRSLLPSHNALLGDAPLPAVLSWSHLTRNYDPK